MLEFALTKESAQLGDHVFVIVPKVKTAKNGRRIPDRSGSGREVMEMVIDQIHYGWSHVSSTYEWSCALAQIVNDDNPLNGRYIQNVSLEDCFRTEQEARQELQRRVSAK
ncbi:MAG: hypothetical protein IJI27_05440 [Oscillospiraceae bacterium]|nr:hypothetical protein [Oscillospiraceae bacterium]